MRFSDILTEGGNIGFTVNGEQIQGGRIHRDDILPTVRYISKLTGIDTNELMDGALGSVGKQESSGDIDVALNQNDADFEQLADVVKQQTEWVKVNPGLKSINLLVPIQGENSKQLDEYNGYVQVDIFFGKKAWMKFAYFSAGETSKYKGLYRTMLIGAVAAARTQFTDYDEQGELLAKVGEVFDLNKGILTQFRMRPRKKTGSGYVKGMKPVGRDDPEWQERYGSVEAEVREIDDPKEAAEFLFGPGTDPSELDSFEGVLEKVRQLPRQTQNTVEKIFELRSGYPISDVPTTN
jgi:hypothetical protein